MFKIYLKTKIKDVTAWIGIAVIISTVFFPHVVSIFLGLCLVFSSDKKINELVEEMAKKADKGL